MSWLRRLALVLALGVVLALDYFLPKPRAIRRIFALAGRRQRSKP